MRARCGGVGKTLGRGLVLAFISAICGFAAPGEPLPGATAPWKVMASPNFELFTSGRQQDSVEILENLEILRALFFEQLKLKEKRRIPVTVFYFGDRTHYRAYQSDAMQASDSITGFYRYGIDRSLIVLSPFRRDEQVNGTVFHELVHHLFRVVEANPPAWYNEGTAELLGALQVERKRILIGTPQVDRAFFLQVEDLMPLEKLFATEPDRNLYGDSDHAGVFYAQSWAFLHFLMFGDSGFSRTSVDEFLRIAGDAQAASEADIRAHFQKCFGTDYGEMENRLRKYIRSGSYRTGVYPKPETAPVSTYRVRPATAEEIQLRLAELKIRVRHDPAAKLKMLREADAPSADPRVSETLGALAYEEGDMDKAEEWWERAIKDGATNPALVRELAMIESNRWLSDYDDDYVMPDETAERLRARLLKSIEVEPHQAASHERLIWVEAFARLPNAANINRVIQHLPAMPDKRRTLIALARLLIRTQQPQKAEPILNHLGNIRLEHADSVAVSSLEMRMNRDFPDFKRTVSEETKAQMKALQAPEKPAIGKPSVTLPDDL